MFGNCATGRAAIVTAPTITVRIEMTMATIGRFMKNFDNLLPLLTFRLFLVEWLRIHCLARNGLLYALDDHALTGLQAFRDHPHRADSITDLDRLNAHCVVVIN